MPDPQISPSLLKALSSGTQPPRKDLEHFCSLLALPSQIGQTARDAVLEMPPIELDEFGMNVLAAVRANSNLARPALSVAALIEPFTPTTATNVALASLLWARELKDAPLMAEAICHLNSASTEEPDCSGTKIQAYQRAFELVFGDVREPGVRRRPVSLGSQAITTILPFASHFLALIEEGKRWDLGVIWAPRFREACETLPPDKLAPSIRTEIIAIAGRIQEATKAAPHHRVRSTVLAADTAAVIEDAAIATEQLRFGHADLLLLAGMRRLGSSNENFYGSPQTLPLLISLAIARVNNFYAASQADGNRTSAEDRATARALCRHLDDLYWSEGKLPRSTREAIKSLTSRADILEWLRLGTFPDEMLQGSLGDPNNTDGF